MPTDIRPTLTEPSRTPFNPGTNARSFSRVWTIFRKEIREIFRDRRTLMSVVISPVLITPALFALLGILINSQTDKMHYQTVTVGLVGSERAPQIFEALSNAPHVKVIVSNQRASAEQRMRHSKLNAVVILPDDVDAKLKAGRTADITILEDAGNQTSQGAAARMSSFFATYGEQVTARRLQAHNLPTEYATPFHVEEKTIQTAGGEALIMLSMLLPYMLVISIFAGAIYAAFDQVAGEKERGTLETLLVSPASRRDIVLGKFGAVVGVCLISSLLTIAGLSICFFSGAKAYAWLAKGGVHVSLTTIGVILFVLIPLSVLFAGLLLAVSTFARNQKEAQTYLAPLFVIILMPAMSSMILGTDVSPKVAWIPILNTSIIIKQALSNSYDPLFIVIAFTASAFYAAIALTFATWLFQKESVLIKA